MKKPLKVLVVEDSEDDTQLLVAELSRGGFEPAFERVDSAAKLLSALEKQSWDVILSDDAMPGFSSLAALEVLKERGHDIPFIVVSGAIGEEAAVSIMKAGARDYVAKDDLTGLVPSIERELSDAEDRRARREAENALTRSRQELEDFFDHAPVGMHWEGPDGTILRANEAELNLLGCTRDEYVGHNIAEFHADDGVPADILKRLKRGEMLDGYEARLRCKDGAIKHVAINANALWEHGKLIHSRAFTLDITDRREAQAALAYLAAIVESSEDAIVGKTLDGTILTWNSGAEKMYGYSAEEVKGRSVSILVPPYRPEELPQIYEKIKRGEWIQGYETVRVRKDGKTIEVSLTLSPIKNAVGAVIGISAIERDVTARKGEEAERLKLIHELTDALGNIKTLKGLLPICSSCKKIRDDKGYWQRVESYISEHTQAEFTHGICPECVRRVYPEYTVGQQPSK